MRSWFVEQTSEESMKKILIAMLLFTPSLAVAQKAAPGSAEYTIAVHVQGSQLVNVCGSDSKGSSCGWMQKLTVTIDGKKYEIEDGSERRDLLHTGDYKAKILKDETTRPYEYRRIYEFQFADGKTRKFIVVGEFE
jgi:hypothetical protein